MKSEAEPLIKAITLYHPSGIILDQEKLRLGPGGIEALRKVGRWAAKKKLNLSIHATPALLEEIGKGALGEIPGFSYRESSI